MPWKPNLPAVVLEAETDEPMSPETAQEAGLLFANLVADVLFRSWLEQRCGSRGQADHAA